MIDVIEHPLLQLGALAAAFPDDLEAIQSQSGQQTGCLLIARLLLNGLMI